MKELLRFDKKQKFLLWDMETESLNLWNARPWQLAWLRAEGDKILDIQDKYIWWQDLKIGADAARITRFNYIDYKKRALPPKEVNDEFESYLYNPEYIIVFQNGINFDVYIHNILRKQLGLKTDYSYMKRCLDTKCLASFLKLNNPPPIDRENMLLFQYKLQNSRQKGMKTSLSVISKEYGIQVDESKLHNAAYDLTLNWLVFRKQLWEIEI